MTISKLSLLPGLLLSALVILPAQAADVPVDRVVLSTSGLADFELKAKVSGDADLEFPVRLSQVDDVLKSLVVFDGKGRIGGVTLPGRQPLPEIFRDLPFTQDQLSSPAELINAYQGAELAISGPAIKATGRIVRVEPETQVLKDGGTIMRHRITLLTAEGMRQAVLEELSSWSFTEDKPKAEIARALAALRENAAEGRRTLTVHLKGEGSRDVRLAYVVDAPLWKAAYRMVMPAAGDNPGLLQGWAVIENMTANDWADVDLSLVSGNPVTFRQALYPAYYVQRPEIPVQVFGRVMPRVDSGVLDTAAAVRSGNAPVMMKSMRAAAPAPMMAQALGMASAEEMSDSGFSGGNAADFVASAAAAAQTSEATTQVLFRFPGRFSLKAGQSMLLPFVSREAKPKRVSLYQPETHPQHPLAAVEIENAGDAALPPGILTLYEDSGHGPAFVGDAEMPALARGEKRFVSYALDSRTRISREEKSAQTEDRISVAEGVLRASVVSRLETVYTVKAPAAEARTVVLERPRLPDYALVSPDPKTVEATDTHYRVSLDLKAGESRTVSVVLERQMWQTYALANLGVGELLDYARARGQLSPEARKTFAGLADARRALDAIDRELSALAARRSAIFADQERLRENLKSFDGASAIKARTLSAMDKQEDELAELDAQTKALDAKREEALRALQEKIAEVEI